MPNDKQAPWSTGPGSRVGTATPPPAPRALNPETGEPIPRLTLRQKLTLTSMKKVLTLVIGWISRRLGTAVAGAAVVIGASPEEANATTAFLTAGAVFLAELLLKWVRLKYLKLTGKATPA